MEDNVNETQDKNDKNNNIFEQMKQLVQNQQINEKNDGDNNIENDNDEIEYLQQQREQIFEKGNSILDPSKVFSMQDDMIQGWKPKYNQNEIYPPIAITYQDTEISQVLSDLYKTHPNQIIYLGFRPFDTYQIYKQLLFKDCYKSQMLQKKAFIADQSIISKFNLDINIEQQEKTFVRSFLGMNRSTIGSYNIKFDSIYDGGNLDAVIQLKEGEYDLFLRPDTNSKGFQNYYNFKIKNGKKGQTIILNICNMCKGKQYYNKGFRPYISSEKSKFRDWKPGGDNIEYRKLEGSLYNEQMKLEQEYFKLTFSYTFEEDYDTIQIASQPAYNYEQLNEFIDFQLKKSFEENKMMVLRKSILAKTQSGIEIPILSITDSNFAQNSKKIVVILGRTCGGESSSSFVIEGLVKYLVQAGSKSVQNLRKNFIFFVVPMVNVEGVVIGNCVCNFIGQDLGKSFFRNAKGANQPVSWGLKSLLVEFIGEMVEYEESGLENLSQNQNYQNQNSCQNNNNSCSVNKMNSVSLNNNQNEGQNNNIQQNKYYNNLHNNQNQNQNQNQQEELNNQQKWEKMYKRINQKLALFLEIKGNDTKQNFFLRGNGFGDFQENKNIQNCKDFRFFVSRIFARFLDKKNSLFNYYKCDFAKSLKKMSKKQKNQAFLNYSEMFNLNNSYLLEVGSALKCQSKNIKQKQEYFKRKLQAIKEQNLDKNKQDQNQQKICEKEEDQVGEENNQSKNQEKNLNEEDESYLSLVLDKEQEELIQNQMKLKQKFIKKIGVCQSNEKLGLNLDQKLENKKNNDKEIKLDKSQILLESAGFQGDQEQLEEESDKFSDNLSISDFKKSQEIIFISSQNQGKFHREIFEKNIDKYEEDLKDNFKFLGQKQQFRQMQVQDWENLGVNIGQSFFEMQKEMENFNKKMTEYLYLEMQQEYERKTEQERNILCINQKQEEKAKENRRGKKTLSNFLRNRKTSNQEGNSTIQSGQMQNQIFDRKLSTNKSISRGSSFSPDKNNQISTINSQKQINNKVQNQNSNSPKKNQGQQKKFFCIQPDLKKQKSVENNQNQNQNNSNQNLKSPTKKGGLPLMQQLDSKVLQVKKRKKGDTEIKPPKLLFNLEGILQKTGESDKKLKKLEQKLEQDEDLEQKLCENLNQELENSFLSDFEFEPDQEIEHFEKYVLNYEILSELQYNIMYNKKRLGEVIQQVIQDQRDLKQYMKQQNFNQNQNQSGNFNYGIGSLGLGNLRVFNYHEFKDVQDGEQVIYLRAPMKDVLRRNNKDPKIGIEELLQKNQANTFYLFGVQGWKKLQQKMIQFDGQLLELQEEYEYDEDTDESEIDSLYQKNQIQKEKRRQRQLNLSFEYKNNLLENKIEDELKTKSGRKLGGKFQNQEDQNSDTDNQKDDDELNGQINVNEKMEGNLEKNERNNQFGQNLIDRNKNGFTIKLTSSIVSGFPKVGDKKEQKQINVKNQNQENDLENNDKEQQNLNSKKLKNQQEPNLNLENLRKEIQENNLAQNQGKASQKEKNKYPNLLDINNLNEKNEEFLTDEKKSGLTSSFTIKKSKTQQKIQKDQQVGTGDFEFMDRYFFEKDQNQRIKYFQPFEIDKVKFQSSKDFESNKVMGHIFQQNKKKNDYYKMQIKKIEMQKKFLQQQMKERNWKKLEVQQFQIIKENFKDVDCQFVFGKGSGEQQEGWVYSYNQKDFEKQNSNYFQKNQYGENQYNENQNNANQNRQMNQLKREMYGNDLFVKNLSGLSRENFSGKKKEVNLLRTQIQKFKQQQGNFDQENIENSDFQQQNYAKIYNDQFFNQQNFTANKVSDLDQYDTKCINSNKYKLVYSNQEIVQLLKGYTKNQDKNLLKDQIPLRKSQLEGQSFYHQQQYYQHQFLNNDSDYQGEQLQQDKNQNKDQEQNEQQNMNRPFQSSEKKMRFSQQHEFMSAQKLNKNQSVFSRFQENNSNMINFRSDKKQNVERNNIQENQFQNISTSKYFFDYENKQIQKRKLQSRSVQNQKATVKILQQVNNKKQYEQLIENKEKSKKQTGFYDIDGQYKNYLQYKKQQIKDGQEAKERAITVQETSLGFKIPYQQRVQLQQQEILRQQQNDLQQYQNEESQFQRNYQKSQNFNKNSNFELDIENDLAESYMMGSKYWEKGRDIIRKNKSQSNQFNFQRQRSLSKDKVPEILDKSNEKKTSRKDSQSNFRSKKQIQQKSLSRKKSDQIYKSSNSQSLGKSRNNDSQDNNKNFNRQDIFDKEKDELNKNKEKIKKYGKNKLKDNLETQNSINDIKNSQELKGSVNLREKSEKISQNFNNQNKNNGQDFQSSKKVIFQKNKMLVSQGKLKRRSFTVQNQIQNGQFLKLQQQYPNKQEIGNQVQNVQQIQQNKFNDQNKMEGYYKKQEKIQKIKNIDKAKTNYQQNQSKSQFDNIIGYYIREKKDDYQEK
ncbi:hypothetical protein PPERSA_09280 [Pseudocohnilembus persalinus]|uniref:Peptidase M14 domain-containing protein n=1 Tax=Pseudocohnilembus persalinus TaxID=266149 RepID=A0A0V0QLY0_PSEPJ|nr:hypothetical protein PPERSA_09280 [Pseudocohnilembus persalinus]|eukprot:KRX03220.1 hypothetical protein PPERSA_09280 [Pseudocohnilembus persalinus]